MTSIYGLCKPLFTINEAFLQLYWSVKMKCLSLKSGHGTCIMRLDKCEDSCFSADKRGSIVQ